MSDEEIECTFYDEDYVKKLQEENKMLRLALACYANPLTQDDCGSLARKTLAKIKGNE